jgi:hypothetical protein
MLRNLSRVQMILLIALLLNACASPTPAPTSIATALPVPTETATATATSTATPQPTDTVAPTSTPEPTQPPTKTPEPSNTPIPRPTSTVGPSSTPRPTRTLAPTRTPKPTATKQETAGACSPPVGDGDPTYRQGQVVNGETTLHIGIDSLAGNISVNGRVVGGGGDNQSVTIGAEYASLTYDVSKLPILVKIAGQDSFPNGLPAHVVRGLFGVLFRAGDQVLVVIQAPDVPQDKIKDLEFLKEYVLQHAGQIKYLMIYRKDITM